MASTIAATPLSMKLIVDTSARCVVYAEASKEVVDFLFSFLALPVGTLVRLLGSESAVGSVGNLYESVENLGRSYAQPGVDMDALLRPVMLPPAAAPVGVGSLFPLPVADPMARASCPSCGSVAFPNTTTTTAAAGGFVQGNLTYSVMDDLAVAPIGDIFCMAVLTATVRDLGAVQQRTVPIGYPEALKILKASFESKTVLTDVFVR